MTAKKTTKSARKAILASPMVLGDQVIAVNRLHLNLRNPRHEPADSESQAIARLCDSELIAELAQDIASRGSLSPLDLLGVMPMTGHPGHFVSLEGNRRTCALIVAADPSRAPGKIRPQLMRIIAKTNLPKQLKVHVFATESDAKQWIDLRHLGQQGGAGTKGWDPTQQNRAASGNTKTSARDNTLSVNVLDRLQARGLLSADQRRKISVSTITRYLGTPGVRAILGIGSNKDLIYTHQHDEVDAALSRLVLDSIEPLDDGSYRVNSRTDSTARVKYVNDLKSKGQVPTTHLSQPTPAPRPTKIQVQPANGTSNRKRSANHPETRKGLIPTDFAISLRDPVLLRLRREGLDLEIAEFSFSANYVLRALVEQIMTLFAKKTNKWKPHLTDQALTMACAEALAKLGVMGKALTVIQKAGGSQATPHSLHSLGHAVHGGAIPAGSDLKKHFDTWRPSLEAMLDVLETKKA